MPKHPEQNDPDVSIGAVGRKVANLHRQAIEKAKRTPTPARLPYKKWEDQHLNAVPGAIKPHRPSHYHLGYEPLGENRVVVHFARRYDTQRMAYAEVNRLGQESEPNTEWYDDGRVMIETPIKGRLGLFRIILRVAACINKQCGRAASPIILPKNVTVLQ